MKRKNKNMFKSTGLLFLGVISTYLIGGLVSNDYDMGNWNEELFKAIVGVWSFYILIYFIDLFDLNNN